RRAVALASSSPGGSPWAGPGGCEAAAEVGLGRRVVAFGGEHPAALAAVAGVAVVPVGPGDPYPVRDGGGGAVGVEVLDGACPGGALLPETQVGYACLVGVRWWRLDALAGLAGVMAPGPAASSVRRSPHRGHRPAG